MLCLCCSQGLLFLGFSWVEMESLNDVTAFLSQALVFF